MAIDRMSNKTDMLSIQVALFCGLLTHENKTILTTMMAPNLTFTETVWHSLEMFLQSNIFKPLILCWSYILRRTESNPDWSHAQVKYLQRISASFPVKNFIWKYFSCIQQFCGCFFFMRYKRACKGGNLITNMHITSIYSMTNSSNARVLLTMKKNICCIYEMQ